MTDQNRNRKQSYRNSPLFRNISDHDIDELIRCSGAMIRKYPKGTYVFDQYDKPVFMHVLVSGEISVGKYYADGKQSFMTSFSKPGDIFGEILLFLDKDSYDFFAMAQEDSEVLEIPRKFLTTQCGKACVFHAQLIDNLMNIFARKAYFLQNRVQILSGSSLRQRIAKALLMQERQNPDQEFSMTREELAGYVNAARPSVSRELSAMEKDGLITLHGHGIAIRNMEELEEIAE